MYMNKKDIELLDILMKELYSNILPVDFENEILKKYSIEQTAEQISHFHRLVLLSGYAEEQIMKSSSFTHYRITPKGLDMMLTYGGFKNYTKYQKRRYVSEKWMQRLTIAVALATIINCCLSFFIEIGK